MKHFKPHEFHCNGKNCFDKMDKSFLNRLDLARELAGVPFSISSSWRSVEHNRAVGGKKYSSHLLGCAVDIRCENSTMRDKILVSLRDANFVRIGISSKFIHVDSDLTKIQNVTWTY